ncbi:MAG: hypothetical protein ACTSUV_03625 [Candidatus Ranarchaeia archaeon]
MTATKLALDNALKEIKGFLKKSINFLDKIGRPSFGNIFRAFLWDSKPISDSSNYKKAALYLHKSQEIYEIIKNTPMLLTQIEDHLSEPDWKNAWDKITNFDFNHKIDLLLQNAGSYDIGTKTLDLLNYLEKIQ